MSYPPQPPQPPQQPQGQYQQPQGQYPPQNPYQPNQYQQYGQYPAVPPKTSPLAMTGFIMSLAAVVLVWTDLSIVGWLLNLTAFILSIIANGQVKKSNGALTGKGFAVAGIVISSVLFGIFVLITLLAGALLVSLFGG